jgi:hypothetical protein
VKTVPGGCLVVTGERRLLQTSHSFWKGEGRNHILLIAAKLPHIAAAGEFIARRAFAADSLFVAFPDQLPEFRRLPKRTGQ